MRHVAVALSVVLFMSSTPVMAEEDLDLEREVEKAGEALKNSLSTLMNLIEKVVKDVPQYEAPEILENGDIIIRRKHSEDETGDAPMET